MISRRKQKKLGPSSDKKDSEKLDSDKGTSSEKFDSGSKKVTDSEKPGTDNYSSPSGMEMGKILGIAFAVVAVVLAACGAVFFLRQKRSKADRELLQT